MEQQKKYTPESPVPMEFTAPKRNPHRPTPEEEAEFRAYLEQHPELRRGQFISNTADGPKWLFVIVAIAMILGTVLCCVGLAIHESNEDLTGMLVAIGLALAVGCPTIGVVIDKIRREKKCGPNATVWSVPHSDHPIITDEDNNFMKHTPAAPLMFFSAIGILLLLAAIVIIPSMFWNYPDGPLICGICGFLGCILLTLCFHADGRYDGGLTWGILCAASLVYMLPYLLERLQPGTFGETVQIYAFIAFGGVLTASPLLFVIVRTLTCRQTLTATCIYQNTRHEENRRVRDRFQHYWQYRYEEKTYIHKEYTLFKNDVNLREIPIRINPKHPHMFYRRSFPVGYLNFAGTGLFLVTVGFAYIY